jgi:hypothetical protein
MWRSQYQYHLLECFLLAWFDRSVLSFQNSYLYLVNTCSVLDSVGSWTWRVVCVYVWEYVHVHTRTCTEWPEWLRRDREVQITILKLWKIHQTLIGNITCHLSWLFRNRFLSFWLKHVHISIRFSTYNCSHQKRLVCIYFIFFKIPQTFNPLNICPECCLVEIFSLFMFNY